MMSGIAQHWPDIRAALEIVGIVVAFIVMVTIAVKWKIPMLTKAIEKLSERVGALEEIAHTQDINKDDLSSYVKKEELYDMGGESKYMPRHACGLNQENCQKIIGKDIRQVERKVCEVKDQLTTHSEKMEKQRDGLLAVQKEMVAVAQQLRDVITADRQKELKDLATMIVNRINGKND